MSKKNNNTSSERKSGPPKSAIPTVNSDIARQAAEASKLIIKASSLRRLLKSAAVPADISNCQLQSNGSIIKCHLKRLLTVEHQINVQAEEFKALYDETLPKIQTVAIRNDMEKLSASLVSEVSAAETGLLSFEQDLYEVHKQLVRSGKIPLSEGLHLNGDEYEEIYKKTIYFVP